MKMKKWKTIETRPILKGHVFRYQQVRRQSPQTQAVGDFDIIQCSDWVNAIAVTADQKVVLIKQYRHGIDAFTTELPGGAINLGEDPLIGAQRELQEETGYTSSRWVSLGSVDVNPAFMTNRYDVFLALDAQKTSEQSLDPFEEIEVYLEDIEKIPELVKKGVITHSLMLAAFYLWERYRLD
ncbi:MAG: NUDIX hydrolase [Bacteriovorax sp.]|nr:NUDIX hydrolase [Bacteriovorax sp.]